MSVKKKDMFFIVGDCAVKGNTIFYLIRDANLVCKKSIDTGEAEFYPGVPEENKLGCQMASRLMLWDEKLVFIPRAAKAIWLSDLDLNAWEKVEYEAAPGECYTEYVALQAFSYEDRLYIIGSDYPAIMCLEPDRKLTYIREPYQRLMSSLGMMREFFFRKAYALRESILYLASCRDNFVLKLWLDTHAYEWIEVGSRENRYAGIAFDGDYFWLAPRCCDTPIVKWDGGSVTEEFALEDRFKQSRRPFLGVLYVGEGVLFPGYEQEHSLFISRQGETKIVDGQYVFYNELSKGEFAAQYTDGTLLHILQDKSKQDISCTVQREVFYDYVHRYKNHFCHLFHKIRKEDNSIRLNEMLQMAVENGTYHPVLMNGENGQKVWKIMVQGRD